MVQQNWCILDTVGLYNLKQSTFKTHINPSPCLIVLWTGLEFMSTEGGGQSCPSFFLLYVDIFCNTRQYDNSM